MRCVMAIAMVPSDQQVIRSTPHGLAHDGEGWGSMVVEERSVDIARPYPEDSSEFDY